MRNFLMNLCGFTPSLTLIRNYAIKKRFYKRCHVLSSNGNYEIALDQKKLKTPKGNPFVIESEPLALAVAAEWDAQKTQILQSHMHLTGLCFTAIDNIERLTKDDIVTQLVNYVDADTILYYAEEGEELNELQTKNWLPISEWMCSRYLINIRPSMDISGPTVTDADREKLRKYFLSYNLWALFGYRFSIEALKSVSLGVACADRFISVDRATKLSRLEEDYQSQRWGRVEWAHDLNEQGTLARVAAGTLFVHTNSSLYLKRTKQAITG